ncbi:MAG: MBL fold metallo-hydrolase [Synergistaceae bacterium]|nr:MBL fold metallo-hydrolase [Synergistaceae bacterium]
MKKNTHGNECLNFPDNFLLYLGTSGGRFSMIKQLRSTGGIWFRYAGLNLLIDPGPGSLVRMCESILPTQNDEHAIVEDIDGIILTHRHIDHTGDVNVIIEGLTHGGRNKRGFLVTPPDCIWSDDQVVLHYEQKNLEKIITANDGEMLYLPNGISVFPVKHIHNGVEPLGYIFRCDGYPSVGFISDTKYLPELGTIYKGLDVLSINCTFAMPRATSEHLSYPESVKLIEVAQPKLALLTHLCVHFFWDEYKNLSNTTKIGETKLVMASDGMVVDINSRKFWRDYARSKTSKIISEEIN